MQTIDMYSIAGIFQLAQNVHERNHKWWHNVEGVALFREPGELLMLTVSELAEAMEGIRKDLPDDKLPHRKMEEVEMADTLIRLLDFTVGKKVDLRGYGYIVEHERDAFAGITNKPTELLLIVIQIGRLYNAHIGGMQHGQSARAAMAVAMILEYCERHGLDIWGAAKEKLEFNDTRPDHTFEARAKAGGKAF